MAAKTTRNLIARLGIIPLLVVAFAATGCGRQAPSMANNTFKSIDMSNQRPTIPAGVSVLSMTITPNTLSVPVGQPQRFAVELKLSNGDIATDPRLVQWSVSDSLAGTIDEQGVFTPASPRITAIRAFVQDKVAEARLDIKTAEYSWQQVESRTTADLFDAKVLTANEAWVVGAEGTILRFYNNTWQSVSRVPGDTLRSIDFSDAGTGWIVGHTGTEASPQNALALRYINGQWHRAQGAASVPGALYGVSAVDAQNAWAVGQDASKKLLLMKWNGQAWVRDTSYTGKGRLNAIQMLGGSLGWAVGEEGGDALVLRYDGNSWKKDRLPLGFGSLSGSELKGIHMLNSQQGYVVGRKTKLGTTGIIDNGLMLEYDARGQRDFTISNWKEMDAADPQTKFLEQVPLNDIHMHSGSAGWVLGATVSPRSLNPTPALDVFGNLLGFNGSTYRIEDGYYKVNLAREFTGIDVLPLGNGLIVGRQGYVMQRAYDWRQVPVMQDPSKNPDSYNNSDNSQTGY